MIDMGIANTTVVT